MEHNDSDYNQEDSQHKVSDDQISNGDYSANRDVEGTNNIHQDKPTYNHEDEQYSPDQHREHGKLTKDKYDEGQAFKTPATYKTESGQTLETTDNGYNTAATSPSKEGSIRKGLQTRKDSTTSKNFLAINKSVKTRFELFSAFSEKKKSRQSNVTERNGGSSNILMSRQNPTRNNQKQTHQRQQDWNKVNQHTTWMQTQKQSQTSQKNESKDFVVKHIEISINTLMGRSSSVNSLGGTFSKNRREKWYHQTNSSSITSLRSYQSLDVPLGQEDKPFPTTKGNQSLKRAMNQSQVFSKTNMYLKDEILPEGFDTAAKRGREMPPHNVNNHQVQGMRLRNLSSNIF